MLGQYTVQRSARHIVGEVKCRTRPRSAPIEAKLPQPRQTVLDQREFVVSATRIADEALRKPFGDTSAIQSGRLADRPKQIVSIHPRQKVLRAIDRLGQAGEPGALTQKLRS